MKKSFPILIIIILTIILISGLNYYNKVTYELTADEAALIPKIPSESDLDTNKYLEENNCIQDSDCSYIWYTGGCNTPEYVTKKQREAEEIGMNIGEAPPREGVICSCVENRCVTTN